MTGRVLDSCCVLNLLIGWQGLDELSQFQGITLIPDAVHREVAFTPEVTPGGKRERRPVPWDKLVVQTPVTLIELAPDTEQETFIDFAMQVDDGEAAAMAAALHRRLVLATDDRKARRLAAEVGIALTSTPEMIFEWAQQSTTGQVAEVVARITRLARFRPSPDSVHSDWWDSQLRAVGTWP